MSRLALIAAFLTVNGVCFGQPNEPCFAFLLKGDITTVCHRKTIRITHRGDIEGFAVSDDLLGLAYVTSRVTKRDPTTTFRAATTTIVSLKTGDVKRVEDVGRIVSTCGGILPNEIGARTNTRELLFGEDVHLAPYVRFRCSSDRRVVAGIIKDGNSQQQMSSLYEGVPPSTKVAAAGDFRDFNISPDGSKIAWFNDVRPLCVYSGPSSTQCVDHATITDPPSVNNSGEVLVAAGTGRGCVYTTSYNFRPARFGPGDDECLGIGYWKPGLKSIVFMESVGRNPQWLARGTAELLAKWSSKGTRQ